MNANVATIIVHVLTQLSTLTRNAYKSAYQHRSEKRPSPDHCTSPDQCTSPDHCTSPDVRMQGPRDRNICFRRSSVYVKKIILTSMYFKYIVEKWKINMYAYAFIRK